MRVGPPAQSEAEALVVCTMVRSGSGPVSVTVQRAFKRSDRNNSGALDVDEVRNALQLLGCQVDQSAAKTVMRRYDADADRTLDLQEFNELVLDVATHNVAFDEAKHGVPPRTSGREPAVHGPLRDAVVSSRGAHGSGNGFSGDNRHRRTPRDDRFHAPPRKPIGHAVESRWRQPAPANEGAHAASAFQKKERQNEAAIRRAYLLFDKGSGAGLDARHLGRALQQLGLEARAAHAARSATCPHALRVHVSPPRARRRRRARMTSLRASRCSSVTTRAGRASSRSTDSSRSSVALIPCQAIK